MTRILVTGSQGTLGTPLVRELRARGHEVWGMDLSHHEHEYEIRGDIREARQTDAVFMACAPELVYHLAAEFGRNNGDLYAEQLWQTNCLGTHNVIRACLDHRAHLVFASSSEAYGDGADVPGQITEARMSTHVPNFHNEYALTKWANERQIEIAQRRHGLKATVLRFFNAYGPGERYSPYRSVVCLFTYRLMHGLPITIYRDYHRVFMYVDDWKRTVANVADRYQGLEGESINIAGAEYRSIEELVDMLKEKLGGTTSELHYQSRERANVTSKHPSIAKAIKLLDHECCINLDIGLDRTIKWMRETYA